MTNTAKRRIILLIVIVALFMTKPTYQDHKRSFTNTFGTGHSLIDRTLGDLTTGIGFAVLDFQTFNCYICNFGHIINPLTGRREIITFGILGNVIVIP